MVEPVDVLVVNRLPLCWKGRKAVRLFLIETVGAWLHVDVYDALSSGQTINYWPQPFYHFQEPLKKKMKHFQETIPFLKREIVIIESQGVKRKISEKQMRVPHENHFLENAANSFFSLYSLLT